MKPGDVVTCTCCGARAVAQSSAPAAWREGFPVLLTWTHGPHPRHEAALRVPELCLWCHERREALGADAAPLYRPKPGDEPGRLRSVGEGPLNVGNPPPPKADGSGGNKAPLERSAPRKAQLSLL